CAPPSNPSEIDFRVLGWLHGPCTARTVARRGRLRRGAIRHLVRSTPALVTPPPERARRTTRRQPERGAGGGHPPRQRRSGGSDASAGLSRPLAVPRTPPRPHLDGDPARDAGAA